MTAFNFDLRLSVVEARLGEIETSLRRRGLLDPPVAVARAPMEDRVSPPLSPVAGGAGDDPGLPATPVAPVAQKFSAPPPLPVSLAQKAELLHYSRAQAPSPIPQGDLEKTIGLKWAGWIGALVFVIGAALGVKYAYDEGWLTNLIPDWMWLGLIAFTGFALIAAGEWVYRRVNPLSAAGLFAAGVATLFVASYAGHAYYEIYSQSTAFICMALSALVGAGVALRGNMVSIGVVSLLGANLAPMLLGDRNAPLGSFLVYLLAMQIVALALAALGDGGKWWTLRGLSLATNVVWILSIMPEHRHQTVTLVFSLVFAALYQLELIITNWRQDHRSDKGRGEAAGLAFSMLVAAALTFGVIQMNADHSRVVQTAWVLGIAAVCATLAMALPSMKRQALTDLATGYALQAIALTFVAVPVYTAGINVEIGWAVLAVALALVGVLGNKDLSRATSMIAWLLALAHLIIRNGSESTHAVFATLDGVELHTNAMMAFALSLLGQFIAILAARRQKDESMFNAIGALSVIATLVWCVTSVIELPVSVATFLGLAYAWGLIAIARLLPEKIGSTQGAVLLMASAVKWLLLDALTPAFSSSASQAPVILNSMTLSATILIVSAIAFIVMMPKIATTVQGAHDVRLALKVAIAVIGLVDLSIEISRWFDTTGVTIGLNDPRLAKQVALSIFWACYAVASVGVGFAFREAPLRYFGLILLAGTLLKVVTVDLAGVSQGYRILSFIGVGLLMLGTSVLYGKVSPKLLAASAGERNGNV